jgi:membrane fusion protein, multidrug efflux system
MDNIRKAGALLVCVGIAACHKADEDKKKPRDTSFPVQVEQVGTEDVAYQLNAVGSVEAFEKVAVTSRVAGVIERVLFTEGDLVKKGQVLAEIELDRYVLAVRAAQAAQERAIASRNEAQAGLERRDDAVGDAPGLIAGEEVEQWRTKVASLTAEARQRRVELDGAQLDLAQARVRAPVTGIVQSRDVHRGQYAQPGTLLATLLQRDPLLLRFQVAESDATHVNPNMRVQFKVRHIEELGDAQIIHVAAAAGTQSRMVEIAAKISQDANAPVFRPGAFAQVTIPVSAHENSAVIPATAVRPSEKGFLAYVVKDGKAEERTLTLGLRTPDGKVEVKSGLFAGEDLVIRGADALQDGVAVRLDEKAAKALDGSEPTP